MVKKAVPEPEEVSMEPRSDRDLDAVDIVISTDAGRPSEKVDLCVRTLLAYMHRMSGRQQIVICALAVFVALLEIVPLELQRRTINDAIGKLDLRLLLLLGAVFLATILLQGALKYVLKVYASAVGEDVIRHSRQRLYDVATNPASDEKNEGTSGRSVAIIGTEIEKVGSFVGEGFSEPLVQIGMLLAVIGYMLFVEPLLALVSLLFFAPQVVLLPLIQRVVNRLTETQIELVRDLGDAVARATDALDPQRNKARADKKAFGLRLDKIRNNRVWISIYKNLGKAIVNLFGHLGTVGVLVVGGWLIIDGKTTLGVIVAFVAGFERVASSSQALAAYYHLASNAAVEFKLIAGWIKDSETSVPPA